MKNVAVLGAGSWGTALAFHLANAGHNVRLWGRNAELVSEMTLRRVNRGVPSRYRAAVRCGADRVARRRLHRSDIVVAALPSHGTRAVIRSAAPFIPRQALIVSATKGLEQETLLRPSEVIAQEVRGRAADRRAVGAELCDRSGARACRLRSRLPVPIPCLLKTCSGNSVRRISGCTRAPTSTGVEIGGALKNVIAIAAGVVEGLGLGQNALAALITRGLAEITRLACAVGGRRETLAGLSGLGDLVLTCTGSLSRNRHVGVELAHGRPISDVVAGMKMVAEGVRTTGVALALGRKHGIELPIATQMAAVLAGDRSAVVAVEELMLRPQKTEQEFR